jgi:L-alanine-DL-glutamate epimerase-like enolase superfamily enzyme
MATDREGSRAGLPSSPLTIRRVVLHIGRMPVDVRFSYGSPSHFAFIIARVFADEHEGVGECIGAPHERLPELARCLVGADARRLDALLGEGPARRRPTSEFRVNTMRELFSMALHDLVARADGVPLHTLLGGAKRARIPVMPCIFPRDATHARDVAARFVAQGYRALKVKLHGDRDFDIAVVRRVRLALPEGLLVADANRAYEFQAVRSLLDVLAATGLDVIEDPASGRTSEYAALCREVTRPRIMLDAITRGSDGLGKVCAKRAAHLINLHPSWQGTLSEVLARAEVAADAGIPVVVGGTGFTGIGAYAYAHVASVVGLEFPLGEVGGAIDHGMPASSAARPLPIGDGYLTLPDGPGHGGKLDLAAIEPYLTETLEFSST